MSMRCIEVCFDMFEFIDVDQKCSEMFLKSFAKELHVENPEKRSLEADESYHASQVLDACETHGSLGVFFQLLEIHASQFLRCNLRRMVVSGEIFQKNNVFQSQSSMRLTMCLTSQTHRRRMKLQNRISNYWNFMRLTMRLSLRRKPQTHENPETFFQVSENYRFKQFCLLQTKLNSNPVGMTTDYLNSLYSWVWDGQSRV